jgi:tetratricopeptide (TPR) repeat protein
MTSQTDDYFSELEQTCETIIRQRPAELADSLATVAWDRLTPAQRQQIHFYQGLGEGFADRYAEGQQIFADLLNQHELDDLIRGRTLNAAAFFAQHQGAYQQALDYYAASLALWQQLQNPMRQGLTLSNQGILYYELQNYTHAEACLREAIGLLEATESIYHSGLAYNELGLVYRDQGVWDAALACFRVAEERFTQEHASDFVGRVANNIGEVELLRGNLATADSYFARALELMETQIHVVDVHINRGLIAQAHGDHQAGLQHYQAALALAEEIERRDILPTIQYRLGHALIQLNQVEAAHTSLEAAISEVEHRRTPLRDQGLLISLLGRWQLAYEAAINLCLAHGRVAEAFSYAEQARARAFADLLIRKGNLQITAATPVTANAVQQQLAPDSVLLAYFCIGLRGPESALLQSIPRESGLHACLAHMPQLVCFVLTATTIHAEICQIDPNAFQPSASAADGRRFLRPAILQRAYSALIQPFAATLPHKRVIIAPHGPLHQLPFAALADTSGNTVLDTVAQLCYTPSATVLLHSLAQSASKAAKSCLALGYAGISGRLRHTQEEANTVARLTAGDLFTPINTGRKHFLQHAQHYRWLHLACHGEFNLAEPLESWLEIGAEEHLTAADALESLQLDADLVVLSACRSGISKILRGDEPIGLVRAFLSAGAHAVLVTLWEVEDHSAMLLMEWFYHGLITGKHPASALQFAQQQLCIVTPEYADPLYWAGYVLVGG